MSYDGPGIYQHYKGGYYRVFGVAKHESNSAMLVIYHSYSVEHDLSRWMQGADFVARPLNIEDLRTPDDHDPFNGESAKPGQQRFVKVTV